MHAQAQLPRDDQTTRTMEKLGEGAQGGLMTDWVAFDEFWAEDDWVVPGVEDELIDLTPPPDLPDHDEVPRHVYAHLDR